MTFGAYTQALSSESRRELRHAFKQRGFDRGDMRMPLQEAVTVLRADTFDPKVFSALLDR
ncbi:MAG: putative membrane protein [Paracoccaceae bacterium]|jgi:uncharacterized membrane protein